MDFNNTLLSLYQHEVELYCLYQEGEEFVKTPKIRDTLQSFLNKHGNHIETLSKLFDWQERPWEICTARRPYLHNYKVLKNIHSEEDVLKAIQTGELLTIKAYQSVSRQNIDDEDIVNVLTQHIIDNNEPYEYANSQLRNRG